MAKTMNTDADVRSIADAPERTQQYVKLLRRKNGATAQEMLEAVGAVTKHNSWSLARLAASYGFTFNTDKADGELRRYYFVTPTPRAARPSKAVAAAIKAPAKRAARKAKGRKSSAKRTAKKSSN